MESIERELEWRRIEGEAREQTSADLHVRLVTPLVFGDHIAWTYTRFGLTDALSSVHRVGFPMGNTPYTTCGEPIAAPVCWLPLSPGFVRSLPSCRFCESEYARLSREQAA